MADGGWRMEDRGSRMAESSIFYPLSSILDPLSSPSPAQVVMPQYPRRDCAKRSPRLTQQVQLVIGGTALELFDLVSCSRKREIAARPDVRSPENHQEVNVRSPTADAFDLLELRFHRFILHRSERVKFQSAFDDRLGKVTAVTGLLPAEAASLERCVVELQKAARCQRPCEFYQTVMSRPRRGKRHLLFEDDVNERREAGLASPKRRRAESLHDSTQVGVSPAQDPHSTRKCFLGQRRNRSAPVRGGESCSMRPQQWLALRVLQVFPARVAVKPLPDQRGKGV
jgi:hypothetical protein